MIGSTRAWSFFEAYAMSAHESNIPVGVMRDIEISDVSPLHGTKDPLPKPLKKCRSVLAELLSDILEGCMVDNAYKCSQYPNDTSNGNFSLTVPKLCPGCKLQEVSIELINKARYLSTCPGSRLC